MTNNYRGETKLPTTNITTDEINTIMNTNKNLEEAIRIGLKNNKMIDELVEETKNRTKIMRKMNYAAVVFIIISAFLIIASVIIRL